jgi:dTDP-4-dehydrorhamnose 3,5-epimerase
MEKMIEVVKTKLDNVLLIKPEVFEDFRGDYIELYNEKIYKEKGIPIKFVQDDISVSSKDVLRGLHGDTETWKLVSCLYGKYYLVVVNCDTNSKNFGKWESFVLSEKNRHQVLIPPLYGNGHLALSKKIIFHYKQSTYYNPKTQFTYKWDDQRFNIWWPVKNPILSQRDEIGHYV